MLQVTIDGMDGNFPEGTTILQAVRGLHGQLPTLCHDHRLEPYGACRLCVVRVQGWNKLATACNTLLTDGMVIDTGSRDVVETRTTILKLLAQYYPAAAAEADPDKEFHRLLKAYGVRAESRNESRIDASHPYIHLDMHRCVHCFRCVRICDELQGQYVWQAWNRGDRTEIRAGTEGGSLKESSCVSCGACVDTCPTGALEDKSVLSGQMPETWTRSVCPYCAVGCEILVGVRSNRITQVKPCPDSPVNRGHLCVKGRYAFAYNRASDRITQPLIRDGDKWKTCTWGEAIGTMADRLSGIAAQYGPDSIGILSSARGTNEENYLAQKFARVVLGTNNVDCCARVCHAPTAAAMSGMLGTGAATNSFGDIEAAAAFLVCGCNPTENHPVVGERIKQAVRRGAKLVVIDPRRIELAEYADVHLSLRPGTNIALLNALAATILEESLFDAEFLAHRVEGTDQFKRFIGKFLPEQMAEVCGVSPDQIRAAARIYAQAKPAMCFHGLGVTEHRQGTDGVKCLVNLALLTGNLGKSGSGVNPLRGQNNVQGAAHMGCEPNRLTGYVSLDQSRDQFEALWKTTIPITKGLDLMEMMDAAEAGKLKAIRAIGYDIALTNPNFHRTAQSLDKLEFLAVQDLFLNTTAEKHGTLFLPATSSFEREGTFMNSERRIQRIHPAVYAPAETLPDWKIICDVARAMGKGEFFNFQSPREIWNEIRSLWPAGAGISYERLSRGGIQWPCPDEKSPGTAILHMEAFTQGQKVPLQPIEWTRTLETSDTSFPITLTTGRTLYPFNAATMTDRTANLEFRPRDTVELSAADAERLALEDGEIAELQSRYGSACLPVQVSERVKAGEAFATFHDTRAKLNRLTGEGRDAVTHTPEYKVVAVRIRKSAEDD